MSNITKLESRIKKLRKERFNYRKNAEHHNRQRRNSVKCGDFKAFEKYSKKEQFWREKVDLIDGEIEAIERQIEASELIMQQDIYKQKLNTFDVAMVKKLTALQGLLRQLIDNLELTDIGSLSNEIYTYYVSSSVPFKREDLRPYHQLGMLSLKIRIGNIIEKYGDMQRVSSVSGPQIAAGIRGKAQLWSKQLSGQIQDCLKVVEARSGPSKKKSFLNKLRLLLCIV